MSNQYLSRYAQHDTRFHRTDPWPHLAAEWDKPKSVAGEYIGAACLLLVLLALGLL